MKHEEENLQIACISWFKMQYPNVLINHNPSGGYRNIREAARFKRMGTIAGFPDIFIARYGVQKIKDDLFPAYGLFIEMKSQKGKLSEIQKKVIQKLRSEYYRVEVCNSFDDFVKIVNSHLKTD